VRVELLGPFEFDLEAGVMEVSVPEPATVGKLLEVLAARAPAGATLWRLLSGEDADRGRYCYVSVDYEVLMPGSVLNTPLSDGSRVCFGMPMAGG